MMDEWSASQKVFLALIIAGIVMSLFGLMIYINRGSDGGKVTLESGVEYIVQETSNSGDSARAGRIVSFYYTGTLEDGTVFDTNVDLEPITVLLGDNNLIAGFEEGMYGMKEGEIRTIIVPPERAFGAEPQPGIPPNSTLTYEVELISVDRPEDLNDQ